MPEFTEIEKEYYAVPSYERIKLTILEKLDTINKNYEEVLKMMKDGRVDKDIVNNFVTSVVSLYAYLRPKLYNKVTSSFAERYFTGNSKQEKVQKFLELLERMDYYIFNPLKLGMSEAMKIYLFLENFIEYLGVTRIEYIGKISTKGGIMSIRDKLGEE